MSVDINLWAVLVAGVSSMVVGSLWYMPALFGKPWMKLTGVKMDRKMKPAAMAWIYGSVFVASLITAYVLAYVAFLANKFSNDNFLGDTLGVAILMWAGFTAARVYVHDTFEMRKSTLTLLNVAHELVTVLVMAVVIGLWKP